MGRNRFVNPDVVRIPLSDDDWIEIKKELSVGDAKRIQNAALTFVAGERDEDRKIGIDMHRATIEQVFTWLVDWSFRDSKDKPVRVSRQAIEALDQETFEEVESAITAYAEEREREKNARKSATSQMSVVG